MLNRYDAALVNFSILQKNELNELIFALNNN